MYQNKALDKAKAEAQENANKYGNEWVVMEDRGSLNDDRFWSVSLAFATNPFTASPSYGIVKRFAPQL